MIDAANLPDFTTSHLAMAAFQTCAQLLWPKFLFTYFLLFFMLERFIEKTGRTALNILYVVIVFIISLSFYRALQIWIIYPELYPGRSAPEFFSPLGFLFALTDIGFVSGIATSIKLVRLQVAAIEKEKQLIKQNLESEIKFLKNQVNPHFLFNTLNNIYALARKQSDKTADAIMKISKIFRYMLHETGKNFISIGEEIKMIQDYIGLQKLRYNERLVIRFSTQIDNDSLIISPLLLLPFVENAFKHGASECSSDSYIHMSLVTFDHQLRFEIQNNKNDDATSAAENSNIGLLNIRRQLELLYGDYEMRVTNKKDFFKVVLNVNLKSYGKV